MSRPEKPDSIFFPDEIDHFGSNESAKRHRNEIYTFRDPITNAAKKASQKQGCQIFRDTINIPKWGKIYIKTGENIYQNGGKYISKRGKI
jgi:hypothetical protein